MLSTTTAINIRKRMIDDISKGTILPPLVLGIVVFGCDIARLESEEEYIRNIIAENIEKISIIDGVQRTESLHKALSINSDIATHKIRVEFWISAESSSIIYRMLVLNTGQVPWNTRRQLEVINKPLVNEMISYFETVGSGISIYDIDSGQRRSNPKEFQANAIIELYMVFGARKEVVDTKEKLADDFNRMDIIKLSENKEHTILFYKVIQLLSQLDEFFSNYSVPNTERDKNPVKYKDGIDIFTKMPSKVGFVVACAKEILGRPGSPDRSVEEMNHRYSAIENGLNSFIQKHNESSVSLEEVLSLRLLNEKIDSLPSKRIGDEERLFFVRAFSSLIEAKFNITTLKEAWLA